jgi:malate synthase
MTNKSSLTVDDTLRAFVETELLPGLGIEAAGFWNGLAELIEALTPENRELLDRRDDLQRQIDAYHRRTRGRPWDAHAYRAFLEEIGYLEVPGEPFRIDTANVDAEIATIAGPQLVVPVSNARFALHAANARWGSLYDALYGTDVIPDTDGRAPGAAYNPTRGASVVAYAAAFLDDAIPLQDGSHAEVTAYDLDTRDGRRVLSIALDGDRRTALREPGQFIGYANEGDRRTLLFRNNGLHVEIRIDRAHPVGRDSAAGVCDIVLEAAVTTIQDCEDSVAAVDAADKVGVYRNWLGLMRGTLEATFRKNGRDVTRRLAEDRRYTRADGGEMTLPGRSLMLVRNVGHLMTTPAVLDADGAEVFEGLLDAVMTTACALYDIRGSNDLANSRSGSVYIVKPKMHGSREAAFADRLFARVEDLFGLDRYTLKIGVMDEERRTTVNLEECIRQVRHRLVFINTGFLDRTGDEIHTSMEAGPMLPKEAIKEQPWISAYENRNVDVGIRCGLPGRAQIGKGMWPKPDEMRQMMESKQAHPEAGANCAWVPSPTAATLHAMHYHRVDVAEVQARLATRPAASLDDILMPPLGDAASLSAETIQRELDNNAQGILGYVVRWIDQGIGCSKVPDINDTGLMEDRATLRISSQHIANWLRHGVCTEARVIDTFRRMARIVDEQNAADPAYVNMAPAFDGVAFRAACELALEGCEQPNGYTEPLLHEYRAERKAELPEGC